MMLAYGSSADIVGEYVRIGESTTVECLDKFVRGVNKVFRVEYLRRLNSNDIDHLLQMGETLHFLGMLGSIDRMHWNGKIVRLLGNANFVEVIMVNPRSCLKQWHHKTCGFDMHLLVLQVQTMMLMC